MKRTTFRVDGLDCPAEEQLIRKRLEGMAGVGELSFNLMARELVVTHALDDGALITALESIGMAPRHSGPVGQAPARESVFAVPAMCCPTEAATVRSSLLKVKGVETVEADTLQRAVVVTHRTGERDLLDALRSTGMDATVTKSSEFAAEGDTHPDPHVRAFANAPIWLPLAISGVLAIAAEIVAWRTGDERSAWVIGFALFSILIGGRETLQKGWFALTNFTLNISFLMSLAVLGAVAIGQWPEAAMVTFLFALAELMEGFSLDRARRAIRQLMELTPETATVRDDGGAWREVDAGAVQVGQTVLVRPGERIPLDGTVTAGRSAVNQAPITGESIPVEKETGDPVFAGSVNEHGALEFAVTANKGNTTLDRIARIVREAQGSQAPTQRFVDRFARYYTPVVVALAVVLAVIPPLVLGQPFAPWLYRALVLLVIACPCALVISTPVTVVSGLALAARCGILVKGGVYLEAGRKLKVVALDKTGTLTRGKPALTDIESFGGIESGVALHCAASLNSQSEHPVAGAIVSYCAGAHGEGTCVLLPVTNFEALAGRGVKGTLNGRTHYIGSHRLAHENHRCSPEVDVVLERLERDGKTTVVLTTDERPLAVIGVADTLRETSVEAVRELHELGIRTVMLTGDNPITAAAIGSQVGIDDVRGSLLPEDKIAAIDELLHRFGGVGMVGDGINDAPALARATVGFAMGAAGTDTALETADVALMEDDLRKLPLFIRISRRTAQVLAQNIGIALAIKVVFLGLAATGRATLWMAVFADMGGSLLVVANGLRLLNYRHPDRRSLGRPAE